MIPLWNLVISKEKLQPCDPIQNSRRICDAIVEKWGEKKEEEEADEQE